MSPIFSPRRRELLKWLSAAGVLGAASPRASIAQSGGEYKALVCVYLYGGNDGENTLIRYDSAGYQTYASIRPPASGVNIPQAQLLPIQPARGGPPYGLHPACGALQALFQQRKLAVVANTGTLVAPSTKAGLETQSAPRPANLFSHNDQQLAQQSADYTGQVRLGWGGRIADKLDAVNGSTLFPALSSIHGLDTFVNGATSVPLAMPDWPTFSLSPSYYPIPQFDALREAAIREMLAQSRDNAYDAVARLYASEGLASASVATPILGNPTSVVMPIFAGLGSSLAKQLRNVALLIEGRGQTRLKRQVFFVGQQGYDTHGSQLGLHQQLLTDFSQAIAAFQSAMSILGTTSNVTLFTLSDFGRAFKPAANNGTDHGWGNYAFVIGGAVKGGDFYGTVPTMALNGPDDFGTAGRWIPTTSIEQYGATLCRWFGIAEGDLPYIFPNLGAFANTNLGFMS
ncbi:MAG TPA: DUF1501 domain-containing protein [Blastocatellia bacterium]|nr:DUF1501 domain-containing protein [Blastocatellia bacterium]